MNEGRTRVRIEHLQPEIDNGRYPIKRVVGEPVTVTVDVFTDGHDRVRSALRFKGPRDHEWSETAMLPVGNDRWRASFQPAETGAYSYTVCGWVDHFATWQSEFRKRHETGEDLAVHFLVGAQHVQEAITRADTADRQKLEHYHAVLHDGNNNEKRVAAALSPDLSDIMERNPDRRFAATYPRELSVVVERSKALFSTWYERFPRSCSPTAGKHGTFTDCKNLLPEIANMGFDVWYLPPIHPIGVTNRKGKNNSTIAERGDVGSPWAIGGKEGGHKSIHSALGTMKEFEEFRAAAENAGIEIALDIAFQCSPDHPYVAEHPSWFKWKPDGTVQYAENPPKKYQDVLPFDFESDDWKALWEELKSVVLFWADHGIRMFRVDNPHTKPFPFWEWLIEECKRKYPGIIFLAEAFTRPKVMYGLAKAGFAQSYTYFTWRNTKPEFIDYITHLLNTEVREIFRPNFWPNTPDILPEHLQYGGRSAFVMRLLLSATMSSNYGIYGPPFELCVSEAVPGKEEYLHSEKYEVRHWDWGATGNLKDLIARVNAIRRENAALQTTWNLRFYDVDNEYLLFYGKATEDLSNIILVVVNLDPAHTQSGWVSVPVDQLSIPANHPYLVHELLTGDKFIWHGERNFVQLDPHVSPAHIFRVRKQMKRETDFDYYF